MWVYTGCWPINPRFNGSENYYFFTPKAAKSETKAFSISEKAGITGLLVQLFRISMVA